MPPTVLIALGANLPAPDGTPPLATLRRAVADLDGLAGLRLTGLSRFYRTQSIPPGDPDYINAVASLAGPMPDPATLLSLLQALEARAGRARTTPNAPRPLDLDIIDIAGLVRTAPDPILPHPRAHQRGFVLRPLADILPDWRHPTLGQTATELLRALPTQPVEPIACCPP